MSFLSRLSHAWDAFKYGDPRKRYDYGNGYSLRPDTYLLNFTSERTFIASIYNRIAVDVSSVDFRHVRVDGNGQYIETIKSSLNECLSLSANLDQTGRAFIQDVVLSMIDEGNVAIMPVTGELNTEGLYITEVKSLRVAQILEWYPRHVKLRAYNDVTGQKQETVMPKSLVAIVENPFYSAMNGPNTILKRIVRKLNYLDDFDAKSSADKLNMIIQLPYVVKTEERRRQAEKRLTDIQTQLDTSKFGIAYTDGTEKIVQLNRPVENTLLSQIEYFVKLLYSQLGITDAILNGTASEEEMLNYYTRLIEPIATAIAEALKRTFLTKTARTQGQSIMFFRDPFKLVTVNQLAQSADVLSRNEIMSANEFRSILGYKPSDNPRSYELSNKNMPRYDKGYESEEDFTESDYQQAFKDLDEIDENLDNLEASLDLEHYASPYYDPVKAHEYYMRTRELKGRKSTARLNDTGKAAARYVKDRLTEERKSKQQEVSDETKEAIADVSAEASSQISSARERKKQQIENHKAAMNAKIDSLRASLKGLSGNDKKAKSAEVQGEIATLREQNKAQRELLTQEYSEYAASVREERKESVSNLRATSRDKRAGIKTEYDEKYIQELEKIRSDPSMIKSTKTSTKRSKSRR